MGLLHIMIIYYDEDLDNNTNNSTTTNTQNSLWDGMAICIAPRYGMDGPGIESR